MKNIPKYLRVLTTVLAASALALTATTPAQAAAPSVTQKQAQADVSIGEPTPAQERQIRALEAQLQPLVDATVTGSDFSFDPNLALDLGASKKLVRDYATTFQAVGGFVEDADVWATGTVPAPLQARAACTGKSGYTGWYITGWQWALNSCQTSKLISLANLGTGGAGAIAALLAGGPAGAAAGVAAAVAVMGSAFLAVCQSFSSKNAIYVNSGTLSLPTCWKQ